MRQDIIWYPGTDF